MSNHSLQLPSSLPHISVTADEFEQMMIDFNARLLELVGVWRKSDVETTGLSNSQVRCLDHGMLPSRRVLETLVTHRQEDTTEWEKNRWQLRCLTGTTGFGGPRDFGWMLRNWLYHKNYSGVFPERIITSKAFSNVITGRGLPRPKQLYDIIKQSGGSDEEWLIWENYLAEATARPAVDNGFNIGLQLDELISPSNHTLRHTAALTGINVGTLCKMRQGYRLPSFAETITVACAYRANPLEWAERWHAARDQETRLDGAFGDKARLGDELRRLAKRVNVFQGYIKIIDINLRDCARKARLSSTVVANMCNGKRISSAHAQLRVRNALRAYGKK